MKTKQQQRIELVCDYISQHLDEPLSLETLSEVACCSKYHFHRLFVAGVGLSVTKYAQLARLKRASFRLAFEHQLKIIDVALEAQFDSPEAFSRAFKRTFTQSPSEFRSKPNWPNWHTQFEFSLPDKKVCPMNVNIVDFKAQSVALLTHQGAANTLMNTAAQFIEWRKESGF